MSTEKPVSPVAFDAGEDQSANTSTNPTLGDIILTRLSRRDLMGQALAVTAMGAALGSFMTGEAAPARAEEPSLPDDSPSFGFDEILAGSDERHHVAPGYDADILIRWGDKVLADAPAWDPSTPSAEAQSRQFGYNNDFIGFVPLGGRSDHGLLVVNHEYTNDELMYPSFAEGRPRKDAIRDMSRELVEASMQAHGGSVIEIKRDSGHWRVVDGSAYARRITATTPMRLSGPAAGHDLLRTSADPSGTAVVGMLNNCAGGVTPWGTWLTCEENFNYYFWNKPAAEASAQHQVLARYGIPEEYYPWGRHLPRFDVGREPNEPNRFGWVVEIDPMDPSSTPVKRTALGRFKHEGAGNVVNKDGRFVVYQGDDQRFDYVYRFVTERAVHMTDRTANRDILDSGTLFVARFDADGRGEWLPLKHGDPRLAAFKDQGEILIHARLAADALGATKMDRPEDIDVNPRTGKVYVMLTNNKDRGKAGQPGTDAANPRAPNPFGHIIEITPDDGDHAAPTFRWEMLVRCGDPAVAEVGATFNLAYTSPSGWFGMPDNCAFDADGRLWVATDGNSLPATGRADGLWAIETEGRRRASARLFFRCPTGAELCGPCFTPDGETLFLSVQHPGESEDKDIAATFARPLTRWPDFEEGRPPRPSVVAVTRKNGGRIGS